MTALLTACLFLAILVHALNCISKSAWENCTVFGHLNAISICSFFWSSWSGILHVLSCVWIMPLVTVRGNITSIHPMLISLKRLLSPSPGIRLFLTIRSTLRTLFAQNTRGATTAMSSQTFVLVRLY